MAYLSESYDKALKEIDGKDRRISELEAKNNLMTNHNRDLLQRNTELEAELAQVKKTCRAVSKCHDQEAEHNAELAEEIEQLRDKLALKDKKITELRETITHYQEECPGGLGRRERKGGDMIPKVCKGCRELKECITRIEAEPGRCCEKCDYRELNVKQEPGCNCGRGHTEFKRAEVIV